MSDLAAGVLPVPAGYWSIFALINADNSEPASESEPAEPIRVRVRVTGFTHAHWHGTALSWMRKNIVPAVAGSLADVYNSNDNPLRSPPSKAHIDEALRQALASLDNDARSVPWKTSTLLAFFDSESRVLRIVHAGAGAGRAFLGRRVTGAGGHECRELTTGSSGVTQHFVNPDMHSNSSRVMDAEELTSIDGTGSVASPSRGHGELDVASVNVESVEVRDGDFLVLGSHDIWSRSCLDGNEAVQAVSGWMQKQEQEVATTSTQEQEQQPVRRGSWWWRPDRFLDLDFPWREQDNHGFGFGFDWVHTTVPDLIRDVDEMFVGSGARGNAASRVLQFEHEHSQDGSTRRHGRSGPQASIDSE